LFYSNIFDDLLHQLVEPVYIFEEDYVVECPFVQSESHLVICFSSIAAATFAGNAVDASVQCVADSFSVSFS
jgi:hypothetical protein